MNKKQLFINAVSSKAGGGVNDLVHTLPLLDAALKEHDWHLRTWVVEPGWQALEAAGYDLSRVELVDATTPLKRAGWEYIRFPRLVRGHKPDVVFHFSNFILRRLNVPQMTVLRSPTFFSEQYARRRRTGLYQKFRYWAGCRFSGTTIHRADRIFCISETHRQDILRTVGPRGEKVETSYLGFEGPSESQRVIRGDRRAILSQLPEESRELLAPLCDPKRKIVLNVAHYYEHKNLGDLLEATLLLRKQLPEIVLVITAGLTQYEGPRNARTEHDTQLAKRLAEEGILFDLGAVPKDWVWSLLGIADAFAFPSSLESFGHPLLEAMSMQVPVVAADTPIHREIAADGAWYHEVGSPESLAGRLGHLLNGQADLSKTIERGLSRVEDFTWRKHVDTLCDAIESASYCSKDAGDG